MLRRAILVAAMGLLAWAGPGRAQSSDPSFRVVNNTPNVVNEVYASPTSERSWGQDRLGDQARRDRIGTVGRMPPLSTLPVFAAASLALLVIPGPAVLYIVARSSVQGPKAGMVSVLGVHTASLIHVLAAVVGDTDRCVCR